MTDIGSSDDRSRKPVWNSLEIAKLVVGILTPITLLVIGHQLSRGEKERASQAVRFERVAEQRIRLWQELGPPLNDIYAYLMYVGRWKELTASDVISAKRTIDKTFYANRPFFSDDFAAAYETFADAAFRTFNRMGTDAKPRTTATYRPADSPGAVSGEENSDAVHASYYRLLQTVAEDFDLKVNAPARRPRTPAEDADRR